MSIKFKFTSLLLVASFLPLFILGIFSFLKTKEAVTNRIVSQLETLASVQEERIFGVVDLMFEQVESVTSAEDLLEVFSDYKSNPNSENLLLLSKKADEEASSERFIESIAVLDIESSKIYSTASYEDSNLSAVSFEEVDTIQIKEVFKDRDNILKALVVGPLINEGGKKIGFISVVVGFGGFIEATEDHTGLGLTGEVVLAQRNEAGDAVFLTPLRFDAGAALRRATPKEKVNAPIVHAVAGVEKVFIDKNFLDYRGESVFAASRFLEPLGWGLVAKIDRDEALLPVRELVFSYLVFALIIMVLVAIFALILSRSITRPIKSLSLFAQNLQSGNFSMRTEIKSKDEMGLLAKTLNEMAEKLQDLYRGLENKVRERTVQIEEARAKDEAILASIGEGLVFTDLQKRVVFVNHMTEKLLGWKANEMVGKNWLDIVRVKDMKGRLVETKELPIYAVLEEQSTTIQTSRVYMYTKKDNSLIPVSITASPVFVKGKIVGGIIVFRDITQEQAVDKVKTEFVSLASHQLRTPLSTVNWYAEMLLAGDAGKITDEQKKYLEEIYTGNQRMVELVNALLNVSRLELGTFVVDPEPTDMAELIHSVVKEQKPQSDARGQKVRVELEKNLPMFQADPKLLRIVFQNLLSNAIKYTGEGGEIQLSLALKGDNFVVRVADNGWGIPKDQQDKIFTKLFRADNVKEQDTEGTGLGLYIVKSIVEHSGGSISFESEKDKGTAFDILLPQTGMQKREGLKTLD